MQSLTIMVSAMAIGFAIHFILRGLGMSLATAVKSGTEIAPNAVPVKHMDATPAKWGIAATTHFPRIKAHTI